MIKSLFVISCVAVSVFVSVLAEEQTSTTHGDVEYYLFEEDPGELYWEAERQTDLGELEKARELFLQSCESGIGGSCAVLGVLFQNEDSGEENIKKSCRYFRQSCEMGYVQACTVVASILEGDMCGPANYLESRRLYTIACETGDFSACANLGNLHENGLGDDKNEQSARHYYRMACRGEHHDGCAQYSRFLISGIGGDVDVSTAKLILEKSCSSSSGKSCYQLASVLEGQGETSEKANEYLAKARQLFQSTCANFRENDDIEACYNFFYMTALGEGGPKNIALSLNFFEAACGEGHQLSCEMLAKLQ